MPQAAAWDTAETALSAAGYQIMKGFNRSDICLLLLRICLLTTHVLTKL